MLISKHCCQPNKTMVKLAHAYLFVGQDLKKQVLKFIKNISYNKHDLYFLESSKIQEIRDLQKKLSLKTYSNKYKIAVIYDTHLISVPAQNAILKTLEEPTPKTILILTTLSEYLLLPTIVSRCQIKRFYSKVPEADLDEDLDTWLIYYRNKLIKSQKIEYLRMLKKVLEIKKIAKYNINQKLILDNLEIHKKLLKI